MIKTVVNVTCSESGKALPHVGLVIGEIIGISIEKFNSFKVFFEYKKEDGTILIGGVKEYSDLEINAFYDLVSPSLPTHIDWTTDRKNEFYEAFKIEMADTFGIDTNQIENI